MSRAYTAHIGPRSNPWPPVIGEHPTRAEAQAAVKAALAAAAPEISKGEVRHDFRLLDCYGKRLSGAVRHLYDARQSTRRAAP